MFLGNKDFPRYAAVGIISMSEISIIGVLENYDKIYLLRVNELRFVFLALVLVVHYLNYLILIKNNNIESYESIIKKVNIYIKSALFIVSLIIVILPFRIFLKTL